MALNLQKFLNEHEGTKKNRVEDAVLKKLNLNRRQFEAWKAQNYETNEHTVNTFLNLIQKAKKVRIIGDYDVDGVCASYIAETGICSLFPGKDIKVRIPKRFSEGYGINEVIIDEIIEEGSPEDTLIITVDNGIAAGDVLKKAKDAGICVAITDHHVLGDSIPLPEADFIVNPSVPRLSNPFQSKLYCGAGVMYKLLESKLSEPIKNELRQYAALATYADVMILHEENWVMVRELLHTARDGKLTTSLKELLYAAGFEPKFTDEYTLGFLLGPMVNAAGRLYDDGCMKVLEFFKNPTADAAKELYEVNEMRKDMVSTQMEIAEKVIEENNLQNDYPLWVNLPDVNEGIVGIVAGKIAEKYLRPAFVVTYSDAHGCLKGSARSDGSFDIYQYLTGINDKLIGFGGHPDAAGVRVSEESLKEIQESVEKREVSKSVSYDMTILPGDVLSIYNDMEEFRPFGNGNPFPVFKVPVNLKDPGAKVKFMGADENHLSVMTGGCKFIHFRHTESALRNPECFDMIGTIEQNIYMGKQYIQFKAQDVLDNDSVTPGDSLSTEVEIEELDF